MGNQNLTTKDTISDFKFPVNEDLFFNFIKIIGSGAFSIVFIINEKKNNKKFYALKLMSKIKLILKNYGSEIYQEYQILNSFESEFIIKLKFVFQDINFIYFGLELCKFGDLRNLMKNIKKFTYKEII